jgi:diaminopimelate decarboxylase
MNNYFTTETNFYGNTTPAELIAAFGSPLYVYNEAILRERCREMRRLTDYPRFKVNYSVKANSNLELLKIVREEGIDADAMSSGEIHVSLAAGFKPDRIFYIGNNVSAGEMRFAIERDILVSVDSISQLEQFGRINPGGKVAVRFNPGVGAGHHEKVVTGGAKTKFGITPDLIDAVKAVIGKYNLNLCGINQHIGSLFLDSEPYLDGVERLLEIAAEFEGLEFIDLGGGFGTPYRKQAGEKRLDLKVLGDTLGERLAAWAETYGNRPTFKVEPGRYLVAECGVLLGTVHAVKVNYGTKYIGTDLGFNVLTRPVLYDSHHDLEIYSKHSAQQFETEKVTVVGNICESGDIIAKERELPLIGEGDLIGVMDAGAYGYCMSSNYNNRLRPAEVLIKSNGEPVLIRRRETLDDLTRAFLV